jgi:hypothetical protein
VWDWAIWAALGLGALAGTAALGLVAFQMRAAWRSFTETRRAVARRLDSLVAGAEAVAEQVAAAGDTAELQESVARLRLSLARLAVLRAALDEAQDTVARAAFVPRT